MPFTSLITNPQLPGIRNPPDSGPNGLQLADRVLVAAGPTKDLPPNGKSLNICVNGQQYIWRYTYAQNCDNAPLNSVFAYEEMVVPTDTTVTLDIAAQDVAHSWWIPKLGGRNHANMTARVRAVTPDEYQAWLQRERNAIKQADTAAQRQRQRVDRGQQPGG